MGNEIQNVFVKPQCDQDGWDTGLWVVDAGREYVTDLWIGYRYTEHGMELVVGQVKGWDGETYDDKGHLVYDEYVEFDAVPYYDPTEEPLRFLDWLREQDGVEFY